MWLPVYSYLIEHPRGYILFDTGCHRDISSHGVYDKHAQIRCLGFRLLSCINQARLAAGEAVDEQLLSLGIKTQDLDYVLLSHLDCDHANGLKLVADAKHILVSDAEKQGTRHGGLTSCIRFCKRWWEDTKIRTFQWNIAEGPFKHGFDLYGDGSVMLIHLPGHSEGLCALKLTAADGRYILLYADGGYVTKSWQEMITSGIALNTQQQRTSLARIHEQSLDSRCVESLATHDSQVKPHTIILYKP